MVKIDDLKFDDRGLIPAIVVDHNTKQVLTLAYMSKEASPYPWRKDLPVSGPVPGKSFG